MRATRIDGNHVAVVQALRKAGANVESLASVGKGVPDLLVGFRRQFVLFEVKDGAKCPSAQKLTDAQVAWHKQWDGFPVFVVTSPVHAVNTLEAIE